jgi:hypothetical protein
MANVSAREFSIAAGLSATINPLFSQGMKSLLLGVLALSSTLALGQNKELTADDSIPIPKVAFDAKGEVQYEMFLDGIEVAA